MPKKSGSTKRLSPREKRDLDVEIGFIEGLVRRDPNYVDALTILGDDYTRRGRYQDGLKVDEQLVVLRPNDPLAHYNLACSYSLTEQFDMAISALEQAFVHGYRDFEWLERDPDLKALRKHPLFHQVREKLNFLRKDER